MRKLAVLTVFLCLSSMNSQNFNAGLSLETTGEMSGGDFVLDTSSSISAGFGMPGQITSGFQLDIIDSEMPGFNDFIFLQNVWAGIIVETEGFYAQGIFFYGKNRVYGDGSAFTEPFTDSTISFHYKPSVIDSSVVSYQDMFSQDGTGIDFSLIIRDSALYGASLYQDSRLGDGFYTADLIYAALWGPVSLEANFGVSFPVGDWGIYHGGLFMKFSAGDSAELLIKASIPLYEPPNDLPGLADLNIMIEPHADFGIFDLYLALFFHPEMYNYVLVPDEGKIDISVGMTLFEEEDVMIWGGLDSVCVLDLTGTEKIAIYTIPYVNFKAFEGSKIQLRWNAKLFPFDFSNLLSFTLTLDTEYKP